jgi:FkbM family methyltransferase
MASPQGLSKFLLKGYRHARVKVKQALLVEPAVPLQVRRSLEYHGDEYCGWSIPANSLRADSVVVDVGLGENVSFSLSLISRYGCKVHGFDPTPRAIEYVERLAPRNFELHEYGLGTESREGTFYLPNNDEHVSGSLVQAAHNGRRSVQVRLVSLQDVFSLIDSQRIDLLKLDVEGTEYSLLADTQFAEQLAQVGILCIEFHHRWANFGRHATERAVRRLNEIGLSCVWVEGATNEEFTFVNGRLV